MVGDAAISPTSRSGARAVRRVFGASQLASTFRGLGKRFGLENVRRKGSGSPDLSVLCNFQHWKKTMFFDQWFNFLYKTGKDTAMACNLVLQYFPGFGWCPFASSEHIFCSTKGGVFLLVENCCCLLSFGVH